jgi:ribosomal protein S26
MCDLSSNVIHRVYAVYQVKLLLCFACALHAAVALMMTTLAAAAAAAVFFAQDGF